MKKTINTPWKGLVMGGLFAAATLVSHVASAQALAVACPGYKQAPTKIPGQRVGKKVQRAYEAYNADQVDEAIQILREIESSDEFDQAYVYRFLGNLLAAKDGKGKESLKFLEKTIGKKVLNDNEHASTLRLVADLNMQEKQYKDAIKWYDEWMRFTCKEDADVYTRQAQAYYETKQLARMIAPADRAIALYEKPNKNPYVLKMTSYYERKMYPQTIQVAEDLVRLFPANKQWWTQLGFFYMLVENYKKALQTFELAYTQGFLEKASEIKALVQLYATNEIPYKSAVLFEKYIKSGLLEKDADNLARMANSWHRAKEYTKAAKYYGEAAAISEDPEHYRKQGTLLLGAEQYNAAVKALEQSLNTGVQKKGAVHMAMMEAYFYQGKFKQAYKHIKEARKDKTTARNARAWEPYIKEKAKNRGMKI